MEKILLISLILIGCATPKQNQRKAVKHYEKAVKFGLKEKPSVPDSFIYVMVQDSKGNEVLMKRPIYWDCPPSFELPKSKTEIRNETKQQKNERKFNFKMYSDSLDHALKMEKQRTAQLEDSLRFNKRKYGTELRQLNKQLNCWNWWDKFKFAFTIGAPCFVLGLIFRWILKIVKKAKLGILSWYGNSH